MHEVITRRFRRYLDERERDRRARRSATRGGRGPGSGAIDPDDRPAPSKFAYPPNLVVVDGGAAAGRRGRSARSTSSGIDDIAVCGLAKRLEEVWLPGEEDPVILPRTCEGLYLLQRVRDEAHRFAITYHRRSGGQGDDESRARRHARASARPGARRCCKQFGSVKRLRGGDRRGDRRGARASGRARPRRSTPRWPGDASRGTVAADRRSHATGEISASD